MAEEEVLNEQIVAPKADRAGINPIIVIAVVLVTSIIIIALLLKLTKSSAQIGDLNKRIEQIQVSFDGSEAQKAGKVSLAPCEGMIFDLTPNKPLVVNLADDHYISTKMSVCIKEGAVPEEELKTKVAPMIYVVQSNLMRLKKSDIFPGTGAAQPAEKKSGIDEFGGESIDMGGASDNNPDSRLNKIRGALLQDLSRNFEFVTDVYPYEFVVD